MNVITVTNKLIIEMEPSVRDVCALISAVAVFHPGQETKYLEGIRDALNERLNNLKPVKIEEDKNEEEQHA
jgi:hypothetical protein